jgi:hypothetical protein
MIGIFLIAAIFWQFRKYAELAERTAKQYCKSNGLQYLSVPQKEWRLSFQKGVSFSVTYELNYSLDGISARKGLLEITNGRITQLYHWE